MLHWWAGQPPLIRFGVSGLLLVVGVVLLLFGAWRRGIWAVAVGLVLLLFSFPNQAEREGYHDF